MVEYQIIEEKDLKIKHKESFFKLFSKSFERDLSQREWEHLFINSPYGNSILILGLHENEVVGSTNLIPQKLIIQGKCYEYYLLATSAVDEEFRSEGVYLKILAKAKDVLISGSKEFLLAFPNKKAYPLLIKLLQFIALEKREIATLASEHFNSFKFADPLNSLFFEPSFMNWRLEHKDYFLSERENNLLICKDYEKSIDVLEVLDKKNIWLKENFQTKEFNINKTSINVLQNRLDSASISHVEKTDAIYPVYWAKDQGLDLTRVDIRLLMSDVF